MSRLVKVVILLIVVAGVYVVSRHVANTTPPATTTTTSTSTSTTTTTTNPVTAACLAQNFTGRYVEGQGAAGTIYASVVVTKTSLGSCTLDGWPTLTLQDRLGAVVTSNVVREPSGGSTAVQFPAAGANHAPQRLTLTNGQSATFSLGYSDVATGTAQCADAVTLNVQFVTAGATVTITPPYPVQPCNHAQVWISPFY